MNEVLSLTRYEAARTALAEAVRVDEVQAVRNIGLQMKGYAKIAKDKRLQADAATLVMRAERKLGVLIQSAKETGQLGIGRRANSNVENGSDAEPFPSDTTTGQPPERVTLAEAGIDKKLSMRAQNWARLGDEEFDAKLNEVRDKIESSVAAVVNPQKDLSTADKKKRREQREIDLGAKQRALPDRKFGVILTDDEWEHEPWSDAGLGKAAANHYPVSNLEELKARPVGDIAAADCVLFMWTTVPHLAQAIELMAHRGFVYKTNCVWKKVYPGERHGMGYWFRIDHEILLVGVRGSVPAPAPGTQWVSVIEAPVGAHSEKPAIFHELIEAEFPTLPKIELNARARRDGWEGWGFEAPDTSDETAAPDTGASPAPGGAADLAEESVRAPSANTNPDSVAADRVGRPADGAGDGGLLAGGFSLPASPEALTNEVKNQIIREGYARNAPVAELAAATGLSKDAVKQRARTMKLGSRDRQRQMASAFTTAQHARRKDSHAE
jgi:N6-adenosine-specific RNA methylase IME4